MAHRTDDYESEELIIRRGQEFQVTVTFDRVYRPESDQIILQFATGLLAHLLTALWLIIVLARTLTHIIGMCRDCVKVVVLSPRS